MGDAWPTRPWVRVGAGLASFTDLDDLHVDDARSDELPIRFVARAPASARAEAPVGRQSIAQVE